MMSRERMDRFFAAEDRKIDAWIAALPRRSEWLPSPGVQPSTDRDWTGVYFVQWRDYIKIGCAFNVVTRHRALTYSIPEGEVVPLAWIYVSVFSAESSHSWHEERIHELLAAYRVRGEWFRDCPTVRRFIDRYGMPWPLTQRRAQ